MFQLDVRSCLTQPFGIHDALITQTVKLLGFDIRVWQCGKIIRLHGRGIRRRTVRAVSEIDLPHPLIQPGVPERRILEGVHGWGRHPKISDRIDQQLEADRDMGMVSCPLCAERCQASAGTVAADCDPMRIDVQLRMMCPDIVQRCAAILKRDRIRVPVTGAVMDKDDGA